MSGECIIKVGGGPAYTCQLPGTMVLATNPSFAELNLIELWLKDLTIVDVSDAFIIHSGGGTTNSNSRGR